MSKRSTAPELIDLGPSHYTPKEYRNCLRQLARIGKFMGGNRANFWALNQLPHTPKSILDVGCGGGQFTLAMAKKYPKTHVKEIDVSPDAIAFAKELLHKDPITNINFSIPATPHLEEPPKSYDVVISTLVCHHLSDSDLIDFLKKSTTVAKEAVIINDLHRHPVASWSFAAIAPICFPNRLIFHDGLLSIKKAFTRSDWEHYLDAAAIPRSAWSLTWHWAFRWIVIIYPGKM